MCTDVTEAHRLLHGGEKRVWCDAGYQGVGKRVENRELGDIPAGDGNWSLEAMRRLRRGGRCRSAKVEHPFLYVKRHAKVNRLATRNGWCCCWG